MNLHSHKTLLCNTNSYNSLSQTIILCCLLFVIVLDTKSDIVETPVSRLLQIFAAHWVHDVGLGRFRAPLTKGLSVILQQFYSIRNTRSIIQYHNNWNYSMLICNLKSILLVGYFPGIW